MEYVYEVYKERSFSKAAANLFISQPSLSANVKRIEKKIGYPIFDRSTKPLGLTECGRHYIDAVEHIMQVENGFHDFVNDWSNLKTGRTVDLRRKQLLFLLGASTTDRRIFKKISFGQAPFTGRKHGNIGSISSKWTYGFFIGQL